MPSIIASVVQKRRIKQDHVGAFCSAAGLFHPRGERAGSSGDGPPVRSRNLSTSAIAMSGGAVSVLLVEHGRQPRHSSRRTARAAKDGASPQPPGSRCPPFAITTARFASAVICPRRAADVTTSARVRRSRLYIVRLAHARHAGSRRAMGQGDEGWFGLWHSSPKRNRTEHGNQFAPTSRVSGRCRLPAIRARLQ
jgi:hypothetical protein